MHIYQSPSFPFFLSFILLPFREKTNKQTNEKCIKRCSQSYRIFLEEQIKPIIHPGFINSVSHQKPFQKRFMDIYLVSSSCFFVVALKSFFSARKIKILGALGELKHFSILEICWELWIILEELGIMAAKYSWFILIFFMRTVAWLETFGFCQEEEWTPKAIYSGYTLLKGDAKDSHSRLDCLGKNHDIHSLVLRSQLPKLSPNLPHL